VALHKVTVLTLFNAQEAQATAMAAKRYERRRWTPAEGAFGGRSSRRRFDYDAYLPDFIAEIEPSLPADIAGIVTVAEVAVRDLNTGARGLGALEALSRQLLRAEAVASSRIEGLEMSHRRLARAAFDPEEADASARYVLGNVRAMEQAIALGARARAFTIRDIRAIHATLFRGTSYERHGGALRSSQTWIGRDEESPRNADFIPPPEDRVPGLLEDLCMFVERDDLPAVAQAAIAHAQFETIHPFGDGNGRVGRCLIHVVLRRRGLAVQYVPPVSLILATDQTAYIRGLTTFRTYTPDGLASWVGTFAQAVRTAGREALGFLVEVAALQEKLSKRAKLRRRGSTKHRLITALPAEPVIDVRRAAEIAGVTYEAARLAVEELVDTGVLHAISGRKRDRLYEARDVFDLVDEFERRLATPGGERRPARAVPRRREARG
jgi:Fic family protein